MGFTTGKTSTDTPTRIRVVTAAANVSTPIASNEYTWSSAFDVTQRSRKPSASARWATWRTVAGSSGSGERWGSDIPSEIRSFKAMVGLLPAVRHDVAGEAHHRLADHRVLHESALVEVADELVHPVLLLQVVNTADAVVGIAEDAHLAVEVLVRHALDPRQHLPPRLEALDVGATERAEPQPGLAQEAQEPGFAVLPRLGAGRGDVHGERQ